MIFVDINSSIKRNLDIFEDKLKIITNSTEPIISEILQYVFENKGKRIRPILVYLCNEIFSKANNSTHNASIIIELMHNATLLHDDVVDKAALRRGKVTVNNKWDDKTAVLIGDYLVAKSMKIATDSKEYRFFDIITPSIMRLSLGELQQMDKSQSFDLSLDKYFKVIKNKTASLIATCCKIGAYTGGANEEEMSVLEEFGENLGIIFQIKDDILDYNGGKKTGKKPGIDILESKVTLPLICAWNNMNSYQQNEIINIWFVENKSQKQIDSIIDYVINNKGIIDSYKIIEKYKRNAFELLNKINNVKAKYVLIKLMDYIIDRNK